MNIANILNILETESETEQLQREIDVTQFKTEIGMNKKILNILHFNVCSAPKHFDEILIFLQSCDLQNTDILILGETRNHFTPDQFNIPGFTTFFNNSTLNQNDGLLLFINNKLNINIEHTVLPLSKVTLSEIRFKINNISFNVVTTYRSPSTSETNFVQDLEIFLSRLKSENFTIFLGDININILSPGLDIANRYLATLMSLGFKSYINAFTRVTTETKSCIDHIFVKQNLNNTNLNLYSAVINNNTTDHYPIYLQISNNEQNKPVPIRKTMTQFDHIKFKNLINQESWANVIIETEPNKAWNSFYKIFRDIYNQCKTTKVIKIQNHIKIKPWITNAIITSIKYRDQLKKKTIKNRNNELIINRYKTYRNNLKKVINEAKARYYREIVNNNRNNMKKIYNIISEATNSNTQKNNDNINILDSNNNNRPFDNTKQMANYCNDYFINIGKQMATKITPPKNYRYHNNPRTTKTMFLRPVEKNELILHIASLKNNSSPGYDDISSKLIKDFHNYIINPLIHVINLIFLQGIVPNDFKKSIVVPIYKSGNKTEIGNYRPISLITTFAKIFEKCLKERLFDFLLKNKILHVNQFGFQRDISTNHAIFKVVDCIKSDLDKNRKCIGVFLDLARAFDTVPHKKLLKVLEQSGIRGTVLEVFRGYLEDRTQQVRIKNILSNHQKIHLGIPQGTVLGPLLFILYINSLLKNEIQGLIISYADDTVLIFSDVTWQCVKTKAEIGIGLVKDWLDYNELSLNVDKTKYIAFSLTDINRPNFNSIQLPRTGLEIKEVNNIKYLGVIVDKNLKWSCHVNSLVVKTRRLVYKFYELRKFMSKKMLVLIYKALVESILQYAIVVWGGLYLSALEPLNVVQNYILKVIFQKERLFPTDQLYNENILNIRMLYFYNICLFYYKNKHLQKKLEHTYQTRQIANQNFVVPFYRRDGNQRFITSLGPKLYNLLPNNIKTILKYKLFAKKCKPIIYTNYKIYLALL